MGGILKGDIDTDWEDGFHWILISIESMDIIEYWYW
jgi:hypothetical protein